MKTLHVVTAPTCNFCNSKPALYDAPTVTGSWAYACEECSLGKIDPAGMGTKFEIRPIKKALKPDGKMMGIELSSIKYWEKVLDEGVRTVKCPSCKAERKLEPDAGGEFVCEFCKQVVLIPESLF